MTPEPTARLLALAIAGCGDTERGELLESFTRIVADEFEEAEFAQAFAKVHKLTHAWMNTPPMGPTA